MLEIQKDMKLQTTIGNLDLRNFAAGKQAQCVRINAFENIETDSILKIAGQGKGFTAEEAVMLIEETRTYRQELLDAGVLLPNNKQLSVSEQDGEFHIVMVDDFKGGGQDCKQKTGPREVYKMIEFLHGLPSHDEYPFATKVMGDFKPDNFVLEEGEVLYFVDYFAPKRFDSKDGLVYPYLDKVDSFDREAITFLCGDRRGQIGRMLALLKKDASLPMYEFGLVLALEMYQDMPEVVAFIQKQEASNFSDIDGIYKLKPNEKWTMAL